MKIGYFVAKFPYDHGDEKYSKRYVYSGLEGVAYNLAINMAHRGHEINVFSTSVDSKDCIEKYGNMTIYRYGTNCRLRYRNISFNMLFKPLKHDVDIAHVHTDESILAALFYMRRKKVPVVVTYHGDIIESYGGFIRKMLAYFYNELVNKLLFNANIVISPSEYYIEESRFLREYKDKSIAIPNGIKIDEFDIPYSKEECRDKLGFPLNEKIILFVGVLHKGKGPDVLIKAMANIMKSIPDAKLLFVGRGGMKGELENLERLSERLGVENYVQFAGFVEGNLKPLYYKAADVFVLPSVMKHESFGIVNLEAMACGIPIVASRIGGVPDVVKDRENGLLVQPKDSNELADAIIHLLENEEEREKMGKNGRKKVEDYSWERIAEMTEKIYEEMLE